MTEYKTNEFARASRIADAVARTNIEFPLGLFIICGGQIETTLLLQYLLRLTGKGQMTDGEVIKSIKEAAQEISCTEQPISERSLRTAKDWLKSHGFVKIRTVVYKQSPTTCWTVDLDLVEKTLVEKAGRYVQFNGEWVAPIKENYPQATWLPDGPERRLLDLFYRRTSNLKTIEQPSFARQDDDHSEAKYWVENGITEEILSASIDWFMLNQGRKTLVRPTSLHESVIVSKKKLLAASEKAEQGIPAWVPADMREIVEMVYREAGVLPKDERACGRIFSIWRLSRVTALDAFHAVNWRKMANQPEGVSLRVKTFESLQNPVLKQHSLWSDFHSRSKRPFLSENVDPSNPRILYFQPWDKDTTRVQAVWMKEDASVTESTSEDVLEFGESPVRQKNGDKYSKLSFI